MDTSSGHLGRLAMREMRVEPFTWKSGSPQLFKAGRKHRSHFMGISLRGGGVAVRVAKLHSTVLYWVEHFMDSSFYLRACDHGIMQCCFLPLGLLFTS